MKTEEDEAFEAIERRQGGYQAKRKMAADKLQEPAREALNVSATVFVYRHYKDKTIKAEYYSEAKLLEDSADWEHIATINPRMWIECHYAEVEALTQDVPETGFGDMAQPAQEPVAWQWLGSAHFRKKIPKNADITAWNPVYSAPQRPWAGLTYEEIKQCGFAVPFDGTKNWALRFVKAAEAKLKEKNG